MASPTRVFQLARELGVTSKSILEKCRAEGIDVKNHMSALSASARAMIRHWSPEGTDARRKVLQPQGPPNRPDVDPHDEVGKGMKLLASGLGRFVEQQMRAAHGVGWKQLVRQASARKRPRTANKKNRQNLRDPQELLFLIWNEWQRVFRKTMGKRERSWVGELQEDRNKWAHNEPFDPEEAYRALDSIRLLLQSASATAEAAKVTRLMRGLLPLL